MMDNTIGEKTGNRFGPLLERAALHAAKLGAGAVVAEPLSALYLRTYACVAKHYTSCPGTTKSR